MRWDRTSGFLWNKDDGKFPVKSCRSGKSQADFSASNLFEYTPARYCNTPVTEVIIIDFQEWKRATETQLARLRGFIPYQILCSLLFCLHAFVILLSLYGMSRSEEFNFQGSAHTGRLITPC
jgi:hypothetical protein